MTRTVRIGPLPVPPPPVRPPDRPRLLVPVGVAALLAAVVLLTGSALLSGRGSHSYDRDATPPATVQLVAGVTYFVSTQDGPGAAPAATPLECTYVGTDGRGGGLAATEVAADSRATHAVASFQAPATGSVTVRCAGGRVGGRAVFVDDADDAATDAAGLLLLAGIAAGLVGAGLVLGALSARSAGSDARVSGVTTEPGA